MAARLVWKVLEVGCVEDLNYLDPEPPGCGQTSSGEDHPGYEAKKEELWHGCACLRKVADRSGTQVGRATAQHSRSLLAIMPTMEWTCWCAAQ